MLNFILIVLLGIFPPGGKEKIEKVLFYKNRVPLGQVDQTIMLAQAPLEMEQAGQILSKKEQVVQENLFALRNTTTIETKEGAVQLLNRNYREHILKAGAMDMHPLGKRISHLLTRQYKHGGTDNLPLDSLHYLSLNSPFLYAAPSGLSATTQFYCLDFYDPSKEYGELIYSDFNSLYGAFHGYLSHMPDDSVGFKTGLENLQAEVFTFIKKYPVNPYHPSIRYFLSMSVLAGFNHGTKPAYFMSLLTFFAAQKELYDKPSIDLLNLLLKKYHSVFHINKAQSQVLFQEIMKAGSSPENLFKATYLEFIARME